MAVVLAGGGSAGHVEPALALADAVRRLDSSAKVVALGTSRGLETRLVPARGYRLELIPPVPLPRRVGAELASLPPRLFAAVAAAGAVLDRVGADVVVGFGGYVALPAYLAARRRRTPIVVHEANARPGLANRVGARLTDHVAVGVAGTRLPHARYLGSPLRPAIAGLDRPGRRAEAAQHFGVDPKGPTLLVFGGSQGARSLNRAVAGAAPALLATGVGVLHVAGADHAASVEAALPPEHAGYVVVPYAERMDLAYAAADLALCRAGAMTCAELSAVGLPAVYVPLQIGNGEQRLNAAPIVAAGGGLLVEDAALGAGWISREVLPLLRDPARLSAMSSAAGRLGRRDADVTLARVVLAVAAGQHHPGWP